MILCVMSFVTSDVCCNWLEHLNVDKSIWWWEAFVVQAAPVFLCFSSPVSVMTIKSRDVTKEHGHR